jgi:hypothetical protein
MGDAVLHPIGCSIFFSGVELIDFRSIYFPTEIPIAIRLFRVN